MVADNLLPVWTIAPNWSQQIRERLSWLSDVFRSETGHEQARALRIAPRRSIEALYTPVDAERSFFELLLRRLGRNEFMMPLWFDQGFATSVAGSTVTVDTTDREFSVDSMALLIGEDPFTFETFTIDAVASGTLTATAPFAGTWPAGTRVYPLRRGWLDGESLSPITNRVASSSLVFNMDVRNDIDGGAETFDDYAGHPLLLHDIDWSQSLTNDFQWLSEEFDSETGIRHVVDTAERAFVMRRYGLLLEGLGEHMAFRKLLYRIQGRTKPFWVPDFSRNIEVVRPSALGSQIVDIRKIGLGYVGGITSDIAHVLIGGNEAVQIDDLGAALADDEERLLLTAPLTRALNVGEYGSFLHLSRLEQDTVTIEHYTDNEGAARSSLAFREFTDGRDGAADGDWPIPTASMTSGGCGDDAGCPIPLLSFNFKNGEYSISGEPSTVETLLEENPDFGTPYNVSDIVPDVGLRANLILESGSAGGNTIVSPAYTDAAAALLLGGYDLIATVKLSFVGGPTDSGLSQLNFTLTTQPTYSEGWSLYLLSGFDDVSQTTTVGIGDYQGFNFYETDLAPTDTYRITASVSAADLEVSANGSPLDDLPGPPQANASANIGGIYLDVSLTGGGIHSIVVERLDFYAHGTLSDRLVEVSGGELVCPADGY